MKVIFLDFDGVINDYMTINEINEYNVEMLKKIVNETDAKVVVTSSHKYSYQRNNNMEGFLKNRELEDLKKQFDVYKAKMESLLISQLELLKEINND